MKKTLAIILALSLVVCFLVACGNKKGNETPSADAASVDSFKTIGDIINNESAVYNQAASYNGKFIYVFEMEGGYYRAVAPIDDETSNAVFSLDVTEEDYQEKYNELASPLAIEKIESLNDQILSQEELDKLVGKTCEELINDGWSNDSGYNLDDMEFWMAKGPFEYTVVLDGKVENTDEFDFENDAKSFTVKSITFNGLGDATNIDE